MVASTRSARQARGYALAGALTIAFSSIWVKLSHADSPTAAFFRCAYAAPVLLVLAAIEDRRYGPRAGRDRVLAVLAGLFFAADLILWNTSIEDVGAGLATVLANVQVVLVPIASWAILSERPSRRVLAALPLTGFGVLLISGVLEHGAYGRDPTRGTLLGFGAGVAYTGFLMLLRRGGADLRRPAGPLSDAVVAAGVVSLVVGAAAGDGHFVPSWPSAGWLLLLAIGSQVIGWLLITVSLPRLPAAVSSLLLMVQPTGSLILGAIIFGESPSVWQLGGVVFVLGSAAYATGVSEAEEPMLSGRDPARAPG